MSFLRLCIIMISLLPRFICSSPYERAKFINIIENHLLYIKKLDDERERKIKRKIDIEFEHKPFMKLTKDSISYTKELNDEYKLELRTKIDSQLENINNESSLAYMLLKKIQKAAGYN